jgi:hypothetical protein
MGRTCQAADLRTVGEWRHPDNVSDGSRPVPYAEFKQRVRSFRRDATLREVAALAVALARAEAGQSPPLNVPNVVAQWSLAGIARTALTSANNHRDKTPTLGDLVRLCSEYVNIADPDIESPAGSDRLRHVLARITYEQFGFGYSLMEGIGRTLTLLLDHASGCPGAPSPDDWQRALGVPLEQFMRIGFGLHVAILSNGGRIGRPTLVMDHVLPVFGPVGPDVLMSVIDRHFARSPDEHRADAQHREVSGYEKWSPNPLQASPLVSVANELVGPVPRWIADRVTPTGLYFIGVDAFGSTFTDALGFAFERYIGTQLALLDHAQVHPEIVFGSPERRSVDYFVVTDEAIILVEVKAARPILASRLGLVTADDDFTAKIGHARDQIENTAVLLADGHPALSHIPNDRPLLGLIVTLEPWHLAGTFLYNDLLGGARIPIAVTSAHGVETVAPTLACRADTGQRLLKAFTPAAPAPPSLRAAIEDLDNAPNPLLQDCWDRFLPDLPRDAAAPREVGEADEDAPDA